MADPVPLAAGGTALLVGLGLFVLAVKRANRLDEPGREADRQLAEPFDPDTDPRLRADAEIDEVATVNEHADTGEDVVVPVATVPMATRGEPDMDDVRSLTADAIREIHPVFRDEHVRHYDVQFEFGESSFGGLGSRECRRMAVPPELAERLLDNPGYGPDDLAADLEADDDGDDVTPPVHWGECANYNQGGGAAAATAGGAAAAGAT